MKPLRCLFGNHTWEIRSVDLPFGMNFQKADEKTYRGLVEWLASNDDQFYTGKKHNNLGCYKGYPYLIDNIYVYTSFDIDWKRKKVVIHFRKCLYCGKKILMTDMEYADLKVDENLLLREGFV